MNSFECVVDKTKLRSINGIMKTEGLFYEHESRINLNIKRVNLATPVYTLKDHDHKGYLSMYKVYIGSATEYEAAQKLLGSWRHWKKLCKANFFKSYLEEWREERGLLEESMARTALLESLSDGNISAAKTILDDGKRKGAGRPTSEQVTGELKRAVEDQQGLENIVERMKSVK